MDVVNSNSRIPRQRMAFTMGAGRCGSGVGGVDARGVCVSGCCRAGRVTGSGVSLVRCE